MDENENYSDDGLSAERQEEPEKPGWKDIFNVMFILWKADLFKSAFHHMTRGWAHFKHHGDFLDERIFNDFIAVCGGDPVLLNEKLEAYRAEILKRLEKRFEAPTKKPL
jgi:hypothetical protein